MNLSSLVIPVLLAGVALYGMGKRVDVYGALTHGAEEGLTVLLKVLPALVGLLTAVAMFRASGALEWLTASAPGAGVSGHSAGDHAADAGAPRIRAAAPWQSARTSSPPTAPTATSAGWPAVMLGSTETTFYTIAVYFGSAGIIRTRTRSRQPWPRT